MELLGTQPPLRWTVAVTPRKDPFESLWPHHLLLQRVRPRVLLPVGVAPPMVLVGAECEMALVRTPFRRLRP